MDDMMKKMNHKHLALIIAMFVVLIAALVLLMVRLFQPGLLFIVFAAIGIFIFSFILIYYLLNRFISNRIKPIYKAIQDFNFGSNLIQNDTSNDLISKVNNEVEVYKKGKIYEIEQLKELEKYRKEFLGNVSHELKTPIFNIQGYILTLLEGGIDDPSINKLYLQRAEKSVDRMISIVKDLETISRLEAGVLKLNITTFNIVKLIEEVYEMQQLLASERKMKLAFAQGVDRYIMVNADREKIFQVIDNLVVNAIKYGRDKGTITCDITSIDDLYIIEIKDDGIGIEKEDLPRIFERFYRVDKSRSREQGGTGLGLSIVKHIIEAHNQRITVKSERNIGTVFSFTLPRSKGHTKKQN